MKLSDFVIMTVVFVVIISSSFFIFLDFVNSYNVENTDEGDIRTLYVKINESMESFQKTDDALKITKQMGNKLVNSTTTETTAEDSIWKNIWASIGLAWDSFGIIKSLVMLIANELYIPPFIITGVITIIIITLISAMIYAWWKR